MLPLGITKEQLSHTVDLPLNEVESVIKGTSGIGVHLALRLAKVFCTTPQFWLSLQQSYDLSKSIIEYGEIIEREVDCLNPAAKQEYELAQSKSYTPKVFEIVLKTQYILNCFQYNGNLDNVPQPFEREQVSAVLDKCRLPSNQFRQVIEGDIIIMGASGQVFAVSPTVFEQTYKIVQ